MESHDVFHSSLLRIHVPNDDHLFPGRMDTQLTGDDGDDEWAVDRILSHHGSQTDASFEILWKSGNVTWLPYYQITHLQALTDYLELLKVKKISKLPMGRGQPPSDDPQISLGLISLEGTFTSDSSLPELINAQDITMQEPACPGGHISSQIVCLHNSTRQMYCLLLSYNSFFPLRLSF